MDSDVRRLVYRTDNGAVDDVEHHFRHHAHHPWGDGAASRAISRQSGTPRTALASEWD